MDPKLAARFARQKEKEALGDDLAVAEIGSAANREKQLDPVLAKRFARQREREETGETFVEEIGSAADTTTAVDPSLTKRWSRLQGEGAPVHEIGSAATVTRQLDPVLAKAWAKQQEEGTSAMPLEIGSAAAVTRQLDPVLAKAFARQQRLEAGVDDADEQAAVDFGEAERLPVSIQAGGSWSHRLPWREGAQSLSWSAVVLDSLTVDLEIVARLAPRTSGEGLPSIVLQRNARGVNFVSEFYPARKRGLVPVGTTPAGGAAAAGVPAPAPAAAAAAAVAAGSAAAPDAAAEAGLPAEEGQVVDSIVFNFSNSFSWFKAKEIELVTLFA